MGRLALQLGELAADRSVLVHCWRGGMRSESVAWLAGLLGYEGYTLHGGYKAFRNYVLDGFTRPRAILILGGYTGSGKTALLRELARRGEQVIDLEGLSRHKGSAFGELGEAPQPTQQQFENELALQWRRLDPDRPVWLEDESRRIGATAIPDGIWRQMRAAATLFLDIPAAARREYLVRTYGAFDKAELAESVRRIYKRLGDLATRHALDALERGDAAACADLLLARYYDRAYQRGLEKREPSKLHRVVSDTVDPESNASLLIGMSRLAVGQPRSPASASM
jgi:tRNA 2-selenouridine synthase